MDDPSLALNPVVGRNRGNGYRLNGLSFCGIGCQSLVYSEEGLGAGCLNSSRRNGPINFPSWFIFPSRSLRLEVGFNHRCFSSIFNGSFDRRIPQRAAIGCRRFTIWCSGRLCGTSDRSTKCREGNDRYLTGSFKAQRFLVFSWILLRLRTLHQWFGRHPLYSSRA